MSHKSRFWTDVQIENTLRVSLKIMCVCLRHPWRVCMIQKMSLCSFVYERDVLMRIHKEISDYP